VARAVAAILAHNPAYLPAGEDLGGIEVRLRETLIEAAPADRRHALGLAALGALAERQGRLDEAIAHLRQARALQVQHLGPAHFETAATTERLARLLAAAGQAEAAAELERELRFEQLLASPGEALSLRIEAVERFLAGRFTDAERLYERLVQERFELASTHCHLARVYLMTGREPEAAAQVELAWDHRAGAPGYVLPRILFFRLVASLLAGDGIDDRLRQMARALRAPGAFETWSMQPVIDRLAPRLSPEQLALLTALVEVLGGQRRGRDLALLPSWQQAVGGRPGAGRRARAGGRPARAEGTDQPQAVEQPAQKV
jgi:tetratricopeptide (TPR) repeat protein